MSLSGLYAIWVDYVNESDYFVWVARPQQLGKSYFFSSSQRLEYRRDQKMILGVLFWFILGDTKLGVTGSLATWLFSKNKNNSNVWYFYNI